MRTRSRAVSVPAEDHVGYHNAGAGAVHMEQGVGSHAAVRLTVIKLIFRYEQFPIFNGISDFQRKSDFQRNSGFLFLVVICHFLLIHIILSGLLNPFTCGHTSVLYFHKYCMVCLQYCYKCTHAFTITSIIWCSLRTVRTAHWYSYNHKYRLVSFLLELHS